LNVEACVRASQQAVQVNIKRNNCSMTLKQYSLCVRRMIG